MLTDSRGAPHSVVLRRKAVKVAQIRDRWRVDDLWWREPLCRMYWEIELADGRILILYHDREAERWYEQRCE